ncbi:hypothetical protein [Comamonas sp. Y33R10-2]|uniref:hypothetical protein n=1 Tax=Comamonas sp. Y33R10-2 TaxID=2853257 RepID=UPI0021054A9F|nr:hypothetical protein [Comamonas sp. Y33R10-2]
MQTKVVMGQRKSAWLLISTLLAVQLGAGVALAQPVANTTAPAPDKLTQAASSVGVKKCLPAINRLAGLAVQGSRSHDVLLDWDRKQPDAGAVFSLIALEFPNAGMAASITAVPDAGAGTCTIAAERMTVAPFTCASIAQAELPGYQMVRLLPIYAVYTDPKEPGSSVSLIDSPPGCLVIRRFVEYHWQNPNAAAAPNGDASKAGKPPAKR